MAPKRPKRPRAPRYVRTKWTPTAIREALRNPASPLHGEAMASLAKFAGMTPEAFAERLANPPPLPPDPERDAWVARAMANVHRALNTQLTPLPVVPPLHGEAMASLAKFAGMENVAPTEVADTPAEVVAKVAACFVHDTAASYTKNFDRFLSLLPADERLRLPPEEQAQRQTSGPKLVEIYQEHNHPGSEPLLLKRVYKTRRRPKP